MRVLNNRCSFVLFGNDGFYCSANGPSTIYIVSSRDCPYHMRDNRPSLLIIDEGQSLYDIFLDIRSSVRRPYLSA